MNEKSGDPISIGKTNNDIVKSFIILSFGFLFLTVPYLLANKYNTTHQEHMNFYFMWELTYIPFIPWMIIPYVSAYFVPFITIYKLSWSEKKALVWTITTSGIVGAIIFVLFPTVLGFDRDISQTGAWAPLYEILWKADYPYNLFPSMHVVMAYLLIRPIISKMKHVWSKVLMIIQLVFVCVSVLLVHQHHVLDLLAGLEMAFIFDFFMYIPLVHKFNKKENSLALKVQKFKNENDWPNVA